MLKKPGKQGNEGRKERNKEIKKKKGEGGVLE